MRGLTITASPAPVRADPLRADVALFVGLVRRNANPLPTHVREGLRDAGWIAGTADDWRPLHGRGRDDIEKLRDVPVPITRIEDFDALFDSGRGDGHHAALAVALRVFFASGGRHAWVVRMGDPFAAAAARTDALVARLIPGHAGSDPAAPAERQSWHGMAHVLGVSEAAMLLMPDLPELHAEPSMPVRDIPPPALEIVPQFVECTTPSGSAVISADAHRGVTAPYVAGDGFFGWVRAVAAAHELLERLRPDMQLLAALPLPVPELARAGHHAAADYGAYLEPWWRRGLASRRVQLAWPWLETAASERLPGGVEAPDARLAGLIAATVLARGSHRTPSGNAVPAIRVLVPHVATDNPLAERVSVFAASATGFHLLSDVTTASEANLQPANVRRVLGLIVRAARRVGEANVFGSSGPVLWRSLRFSMERMLVAFWRAGALRGARETDAFSVECGPATMSQADIDAGRVIVRISVAPAASVEHINVTLTLDEGQAPQLEAA
jgi:hypothetical protein